VSQSEEHLLLKVPEGRKVFIGEVFYGMPYHVCPTCALYDRAVTVQGHEARGEWTMTARNRSLRV
jgi:D-serine deaminase-like pyridoxal phosphate-dependent protein